MALKGRDVMKHLAKMMLALFFTVSLFLIPTTNYAEDYPRYLYGNSQIVLAYGHMGHGTYVDKTSVVSEYYNPPYYRLAANILIYNIDKGTLYQTKTVHYSYNTSTGAISRDGGDPLYDRPNSNAAYQQRPVEVAKVIWEAAYNMPWRW